MRDNVALWDLGIRDASSSAPPADAALYEVVARRPGGITAVEQDGRNFSGASGSGWRSPGPLCGSPASSSSTR